MDYMKIGSEASGCIQWISIFCHYLYQILKEVGRIPFTFIMFFFLPPLQMKLKSSNFRTSIPW